MILQHVFFINEKSEIVALSELEKGSFELQKMQNYIQINLLNSERMVTGSFVLQMNMSPIYFEELSQMFC